jgi:hypothetical protein
VTHWSISKMATVKKVGDINEYDVNSIPAANLERYILHMLNCL